MKKILTLLLLVVLTGCSDKLITRIKHPILSGTGEFCYKIVSIQPYGEKITLYSASTETTYTQFQNNISFVDSINKYSIDDSLFVTFEKINHEIK